MVIDFWAYCREHSCNNGCRHFMGDRCGCPEYADKVLPALRRRLKYCPYFEKNDERSDNDDGERDACDRG